MMQALTLNTVDNARFAASEKEMPGTDERQTVSELDDIDQLVKLYRARILRFVTFSIGDPDLAETITQDCFLKAYTKRSSFRGNCSVNTWLTSIALNLIRDHHRTEKFKFWKQVHATALNIEEVAYLIPCDQSSVEARLIAKETVGRVWAALERLPFRQRTIFLMRYSDEMDIQDIAGIMNMSVNTAKTHLHRAVKAVRSRIGGHP